MSATDYHREVTSPAPASSSRWWRVAAVTAIVAISLIVSFATIQLGRWQYHRYEVRAQALDDYNAGQEEQPHQLNELIPLTATSPPDHTEWRSVVLEGQFDAASTVGLRNRPVDGTPALQYLVWFDTDDGRSMLINVGWEPLPDTGDAAAVPTYPSADTTVTVIVRSWEEDNGTRGDGATRISPEQVPDPAFEPVPSYGMLRTMCVAGACEALPTTELTPLPSLSTGPHLSYAWQWWVIAGLSPIGAVVMIRRERESTLSSGDAPGKPAGADPRPPDPAHNPAPQPEPDMPEPHSAASARLRRRRQPSDEEIEDAL